MNAAFKVAWRYFRAKKSLQAIHIVSRISMAAIAISAAAMIILFSVYNGLEDTVKDMYTSFYPDLKASPERGKFFSLTPAQKKQLEATPGIADLSYTLEDMVLLTHGEEQRAAVLKGVDESWERITSFNQFLLDGDTCWREKLRYNPVIIGLNLMIGLRIDIEKNFTQLTIFYPRADGSFNPLNPKASLNQVQTRPMGLFHIQEEFDSKYVLADLQLAQKLFEKEKQYSALEFKITPEGDEKDIKEALAEILGREFNIANRFEQNKTLYLVMQSEKWAIYAILLLVLLIASFNMIGSQSMLVLEKRKDIIILKAMGGEQKLIRRIFLIQGLLMAFSGGIIGITLGLLVCIGQIYFGWIGMPDGFMMHAYPVHFKWMDFLIVILTVGLVGLSAAVFPARQAARQNSYLREE